MPVQPRRAAEVEIGLVDRDGLDQGGQRFHRGPDLRRRLLVSLEAGPHDHGVGAEHERLEHRHGRPAAIGPRDVAGGRDDASPPAADQHRLVGEGRVVALLDRGEEGVAVEMGDAEAEELAVPEDAARAAGGAAAVPQRRRRAEPVAGAAGGVLARARRVLAKNKRRGAAINHGLT